MSTAKITFIVPAYNTASYIGDCIQSIFAQTNPAWKLIIVNDGSDDGKTGEICEDFAKEHPDKIQYIYQSNQGLGAARNKGMQFVDTAFIGFLDSDDWLPPHYVQRFYEELEKAGSTKVDMIFTLPIIYDNIEKNCYDWYDKELFLSIFKEQSIVSPKTDKRFYSLEVNACRRIFRTTFLKNLNFAFPKGIKWEDIYPHFYLLNNASYCMGISDIGFYYRINTSGQITKSTGRGRLDMIKAFALVFEYLISISADDDLVFCAMNLLFSFSLWSIDVAGTGVRRELVDRLSVLYQKLPLNYIRLFQKRCPSRKQKLFLYCIRKKRLRRLFYDYYLMRKTSRIIERIKRLCKHS